MSQSGSGSRGDVEETAVYVDSQAFEEQPFFADDTTKPDPLYFEVLDQIDGVCLVMMAWLSQLADSRYTREIEVDINELSGTS